MIPNLTDYAMLKLKALLLIQKIDAENYAVSTMNFSPVDGTSLPSTVQGCTMTEVNNAIASKQSEIDALNNFKKDLLVIV